MSQWTHVVATIYYNDIGRILGHAVRPDLGKTCSYDSPESYWDACDVPKGSEGSLQHKLLNVGDRNSLAAYIACVWGDLRDFGEPDVPEVLEYLGRIARPYSVRNGVAQIDVEYGPTLILHYNTEIRQWVEWTPPVSTPTPATSPIDEPSSGLSRPTANKGE